MRFFTILSAIILSLAATSFNLTYVQAEEEYDFNYTIINDEATIIGFTGEPAYLEIPDTLDDCPVTQIRDNAFFNCNSLKQISLPPTITQIGHHAFYSCTSLESIVLPANLKEIGMGAFNECTHLSAVNIPASLKILPESCFRNCSFLNEIVIPNGIAEIKDFCFSGCESLNYVSIGNTVKNIGNGAFYNCEALTSLYIPPSAQNIGYEAAGFIKSGKDSQPLSDFTVLGDKGSCAQTYADKNNINFSSAAEAVQLSVPSTVHVRKVPLWVIWFLAIGGIGFFILSCFIAIKQRRHEKLRKYFTLDKHKKT